MNELSLGMTFFWSEKVYAHVRTNKKEVLQPSDEHRNSLDHTLTMQNMLCVGEDFMLDCCFWRAFASEIRGKGLIYLQLKDLTL